MNRVRRRRSLLPDGGSHRKDESVPPKGRSHATDKSHEHTNNRTNEQTSSLVLPALLAVTTAAYQPAWHGGMLWDDNAHLTRAALRSVAGLWRIWFDVGATQQYYPVVHSAFWIMHRLWGDLTIGYHLVNIALHATSAFLIAVILRRLAVPGALLAAVIFALHPVQVESVAWMTELKNTLSGVCCLAAALAYLHFDQRRGAGSYAAAVMLFVLALLTKTVAAVLPAALLVVFWWQRGEVSWRRDVRPLLPFFVLGLAGGLTTAWFERTLNGARGPEFQLGLIERSLIAGRAVWFYLGKLAWPANLTFIYPRWEINQGVGWQYLYPLGVLAMLTALWLLRKQSRGPLAAMLLFCGTLFPALGFFDVYPFRYSFVADHFQYLASLSLIVFFAATVTTITRRSSVAGSVLILAFGAPLGFLTWQQSHQYVDVETLYRSTLARNSGCWLCLNNLATPKLYGSRAELDEAVALIREALRLNSDYAEAHNNMGGALQRMGRYEDAIKEHEEAFRLNPGLVEARYNVGVCEQALGRFEEAASHFTEAVRIDPDYFLARANLGRALQALGRTDAAIAQYGEAIRAKPDYPDAHYGLGIALAAAGRLDEAAAELRETLRLSPDQAMAHGSLGYVLLQTGHGDEAVAHFKDAARLRPGSAEAENELGAALQRVDRIDEAIARYREALRLNPAYAEAHNNLGSALSAAGRIAEAAAAFTESARLKPDSAMVHDNLASALLRLGRVPEALAQFREALRLQPDYAPAHYKLAVTLAGMGRTEQAVSEFREALKYDPAAAETHNDLGAALANLGRLQDAVTEFREALRLRPDYADAQGNLERALRLMKRS